MCIAGGITEPFCRLASLRLLVSDKIVSTSLSVAVVDLAKKSLQAIVCQSPRVFGDGVATIRTPSHL